MTDPEQHANTVREAVFCPTHRSTTCELHRCYETRPALDSLEALVALAERADTLERAFHNECAKSDDLAWKRNEAEAEAEQARAEADRLQEGMRGLREHAEREPLNVDISDYGDEWCAGFLAGQAHALDEAMAGCPDCGVTESVGDGLCDQHRSCPDCGIPEVWCRRVSSDKSHCWRWDYEQFDESESEADRVREALRKYGRHGTFCEHSTGGKCDCGLDAALAGPQTKEQTFLDDREET